MKRRNFRFSRSAVSRVAGLVAAAVLALPAVAQASTIFPSEVQSHLGLKAVPACTLCHQTLSGGFGTATQKFGVTVRANGAVALSTSSLDGALDKMKSSGVDSDGDCVGDIAELIAGTDPDNGGDNPGACGDGGSSSGGDGGSTSGATPPSSTGPEDPQYGCAASGRSPASPAGPAPVVAGAVLGAWAWLRRRAQARRRREP